MRMIHVRQRALFHAVPDPVVSSQSSQQSQIMFCGASSNATATAPWLLPYQKDFMSKERIDSDVQTNCPTTLGEHGCLHLVVHTSFLFTRCTVSPSKSSKKARCTTDIRMRFLLTILASQDPRPGCLRSHGRAGTTTLTLTVVKVQWHLPRLQNTSKRRQVLQRPCTMDD